jgi:uncharacterized protein with HEPN domain
VSDDRLYLTHILEAVGKIRAYCAGGRESFLQSPMVQDAVIRNLEIIGEATKKLSAQARRACPGIPWRRVAGMRDVLIHDYMRVDPNEVWRAVESDLPALRDAVERLLAG